MKRKLWILMVVLSLVYVPSSFATESKPSNTLQVTIPSFVTTMNHVTINNTKEKYPLLVYKNITYIPLTTNYAHAFGLRTTFDSKDGLTVRKDSSVISDIQRDEGETNVKGKKYLATLPSTPVVVNGQKIDNSKETYPVFTFRNVTYFPLTWKYANQEFGLNVSFETKSGLKVAHPSAKVPEVKPTPAMPNAFEALMHKYITPSIVSISTYDKNDNRVGGGHGVIVSKDGKILTTYEAIKSTSNEVYAKVVLDDNKEYKVTKVIEHNVSNNLALLKIDANYETRPLKIGNVNTLKIGQKVYRVSYRDLYAFNLFTGVISSINPVMSKKPYIQHSAGRGNGEALVNEEGDLIGIATGIAGNVLNSYNAILIDEYSKFTYDRKDVLISDLAVYTR